MTRVKAHQALNSQNVEHFKALGQVCSEIGQLPTSVLVSGSLERIYSIPYGGTPITEVTKWKLDGNLVAIKTFPGLKPGSKRALYKVSGQSKSMVRSRTKCADSLEMDSSVEETIPQQYPTILWHQCVRGSRLWLRSKYPGLHTAKSRRGSEVASGMEILVIVTIRGIY